MPNVEIESELPLWAGFALFEYGLPVTQLWDGTWVIPVSPETIDDSRAKPGPHPVTCEEFLDRIGPAIEELDKQGRRSTRETVAEKSRYSVSTLHWHRSKWFSSWPETVEAARQRSRARLISNQSLSGSH